MSKKALVFSPDTLRFTRRFDRVRVLPLLARVQTLAALLAELPCLPSTVQEIEADLRLRSLFGSASLAGNGLNLEQAAAALDLPEDPPPQDQARRELFNLGRACRSVSRPRREFGVLEVSESLLVKTHSLVVEGLDYPLTEPGRFRMRSIEVGDASQGGSFVPPRQVQDIRALFAALCEWINSEPLRHEPPLLRAALFAFHFTCLHPFDAGNQRTGRAVQAMILAAAGTRFLPWLPAIFEARTPLESFRAFLDSIQEGSDLTPWLEHHLGGIWAELLRLKARLLAPLERLALLGRIRDLRTQGQLSSRQEDLLLLVLEARSPVSLRRVLAETPYRLLYRERTQHTARRDLLRLAELGLLRQDGHEFLPA